MKRIILYLFVAVAVLFSSCDRAFDMGQAEDPAKMLLEAFFVGRERAFLTLHRTVPLGAGKRAGDDFSVESISLTVNGQKVGAVREDVYRWSFAGDFSPGSVIELTLRVADNPGIISAATSVPEPPAISDVKLAYTKTGDSHPATGIKICLGDDINPDDRYGLIVQHLTLREHITTDGSLGTHILSISTCAPQNKVLDEFLDSQMPGRTRMYVSYRPDGKEQEEMLLIHARDFDGSGFEQTYPYYQGSVISNPDGSLDIETHHYRCLLCRLSLEMYNYLAARYNQGKDDMGEFGRYVTAYSYSNVAGGYGVFAAASPWAVSAWVAF